MVVVVGSYNQDLVWRTPQFPKAGETRIGQFSEGPGGKGFNQAMAVHRLGSSALFIAAIGEDSLGANAMQIADTQGLPCAWQLCSNATTGNAAIWLDASGQNQILVDLAANHLLSAEHILLQHAAIKGARVLLLQQEANLDASLQAIQVANQHGVLCVVNPAPADSAGTALHALADILTPNESEFSALLQAHGETVSAEFIAQMDAAQLHTLARKLSCPAVVITLGARGALLSQVSGFHEFSPPVVNVRDTTGAGDCFNGALAAELARGATFVDACAFAVLASAHKVERAGAALAMPNRAEIAARFPS